jgi:nicotinate phosphoribosyltransferase
MRGIQMNKVALLTDLYQLNMLSAYLDQDLTKTAVFELFVRKLPARRGFLMAAGLEQAVQYLENLAFSDDHIAQLRQSGSFPDALLGFLKSLRFTGDVDALPEGTVFFPDEPLLRVVAPLPQAQLVETRLINLVHFETVVASKASRMVLAARGPAADRFRTAAGAWRGSRNARSARQLYRRLCGYGDLGRRTRVRYPGQRHHGPFLHPGA